MYICILIGVWRCLLYFYLSFHIVVFVFITYHVPWFDAYKYCIKLICKNAPLIPLYIILDTSVSSHRKWFNSTAFLTHKGRWANSHGAGKHLSAISYSTWLQQWHKQHPLTIHVPLEACSIVATPTNFNHSMFRDIIIVKI